MKQGSNTVRITGGANRGRTIMTPGGKTHPMGERERIALFNMIGERIPDSKVLDLFCGGGTLGIEALSRGAKEVCFVDQSAKALQTLRDNLRQLGITDASNHCSSNKPQNVEIRKANVSTLAQVLNTGYDIVLADPPYDEYDAETVKSLAEYVSDNGLLVLSHPGEPLTFHEMHLVKTRQYAKAHISIYAKV